MSLAGHSTLPDQAFTLERIFNPGPDARVRIMHRQQQPGLLRDVLQIAHQIGAGGTCFKMGLLVGISPAFDDVRQHFLKLLAIHSVHPLRTCSPATHRREAFSALLSFNRSRSFMRALCNCDLLLPMEHPIISAISLCSYPSISCSTKMMR